ncbi:unnamed protein product [Ceratitis capitata]|uniref:(Mediterranean fruit fly) hypothetical protein n=1 Tax=Ceratitis capitata TaxID=7213 RepID=A0A811UFT2_CERCA|nr:unnamed protein product [Ceratitis capitata]
MHRRGIDFAAIEATAEAYEAIDTFAVQRRSLGSSDTLDGANRDYYMVDNYDEIEVLSGDEIDVGIFDLPDLFCHSSNNEISINSRKIYLIASSAVLLNLRITHMIFVLFVFVWFSLIISLKEKRQIVDIRFCAFIPQCAAISVKTNSKKLKQRTYMNHIRSLVKAMRIVKEFSVTKSIGEL